MRRTLLRLSMNSIAENEPLANIFGAIWLGGFVISIILWLIGKFSDNK